MDLNKINNKKNFYEKMHQGALLTAGDLNKFNTMTIGWATTGVIWGKDVVIVYVRPSRYTYEFMEENELFTVSFYDEKYKKEIGYLGVKSGRDTNKVADCNFHPIDFNGSTTFEEANLSILCKKLYYQDLDDKMIPEDIKKRYYQNKKDGNYEDFHRIYIGEIIDIL